jgi:predicted RNase H-like HicB family nuclease
MPNAGLLTYNDRVMKFEDYKIVLYRQDGGWVAEIPAIPGCYALMDTREAALAELANVFSMVEDEYREKGLRLPTDYTETVNT